MPKVQKQTTAAVVKAKRMANRPKSKTSKNKVVAIINEDHTKTTTTTNEIKRLKKLAATAIPEKIVELLRPNTVFSTSADYPSGQDLNWEEVAESVIFAKIASNPMFTVPLGPAALKAYLWWFMIDQLREVGGLYPEPTQAQVPTFPRDGALPVGFAKFVEHLMPFQDPITGAVYQFRYAYTGVPATTSTVLSPTAGSTDFGFGALGNFALIPSVTPPTATQELLWQFTNVAYSFLNNVCGDQFDPISRYFSGTGHSIEAKYVPYRAPDASAVAIPYGHASPNPGVYSQTPFFDEEMACIIHPPINSLALTPATYNQAYAFDFMVKPLPQIFTQSPTKTLAFNINLASQGQLELILNYGFVTQNLKYYVGARKSFLRRGQYIWENLTSYCPFYYAMNLSGWHQFVADFIAALSQQPLGTINNVAADTGDFMTFMAFCESIMIARTTEYAYTGLVLWTSDDVVSQTNYGSEFRNAALNAAMGDMLNTIAPTVRNGRLVVPAFDFRNPALYGYTNSANLTNLNVGRWLKIGTDFIQTVNINDYVPQLGGNQTGITSGPWAFNLLNNITGTQAWNLRGPGSSGAVNPAGWVVVVNEANMGQVNPVPVNYVLNTTIIGPAAPCKLAQKIVTRTNEVFSLGSGTWVTFDYAKLGGYTANTQATVVSQPQNTVLATPQANGLHFLTILNVLIQQRIGAYFPLDRESVGRSFAYTYRLSFVGPGAIGQTVLADRFPAIQTLSGNSPVQDSLIVNTQQGPDSAFNKLIQSHVGKGTHLTEAVRAALGPMHADLIGNFSGEEYTVVQAVESILKGRRVVTVAPYHTENSASLVSYNSPNAFEQLFGSIVDLGTGLVKGIGGLVTGIAGSEFAGNVAANVISGVIGSRIPGLQTPAAVHLMSKKLGKTKEKNDPVQSRASMLTVATKSRAWADKVGCVSKPEVVDIEEAVKRVIALQFSSTPSSAFR